MAFVVLFLKIPHNKFVDSVLYKIGNYSMNMWFIHAWFCFILFKEELYSLGRPLWVFIVLLAVSYVSSIVVNVIATPIDKK